MSYVLNNIRLYDKQIYKDILDHINRFGFITIKQCANIFHSKSKFGYQESQRTLKKMVKGRLIKSSKAITGENLYYVYKSIINNHSLIKMNLYSMFIKIGCEVVSMVKEPKFRIKRPDVLMDIFMPGTDKLYPLLIEIDIYNSTDIKTLERLYDSGSVQEYYNLRYNEAVFPTVVIISNRNKETYSDKFKIIYLDHNFSDFENKFSILA